MNPILKELGVKEWELQDPHFQKFFKWMASHITTENILAEDDLRDWEAIPPEERLEGIALHRELDRIEKKHPGIMDANHERVHHKTEEFAHLAETHAVYQKIAGDLRKLDQRLTDDIDETSCAVQKAEIVADALAHECSERIKEHDEIEKTNMNLVMELATLMQNHSGTEEPTFVHQMDLNGYYHRVEMFDQGIDQFMRTSFKTAENTSTATDEDCDSDADTLNAAKVALCASWQKCAEAERQKYAQRSITERLTKDINNMTMAAMQSQIVELKEQNRLSEMKKAMQLSTLEFALQKKADLHVDLTIQEYTQGKLDRARVRMERYQRASSLLGEQLLLAECLWILASNDLHRLKQFATLSVVGQYEAEVLACNQRIDLMRQSMFDDSEDIFMHHLRNASGCGSDSVQHLIKTHRKTRAMCKQIHAQNYADNVDAIRANIGNLCGLMGAMLYDGVLSGPVFMDQLVLNKVYDERSKLSAFKNELNELKIRYINEYCSPMNNDRFFHAKQYLWIWFLTEPQIVVKVLAAIKVAAKAKKPELKPVAGIRRKD